jgi:hypothetical protein
MEEVLPTRRLQGNRALVLVVLMVFSLGLGLGCASAGPTPVAFPSAHPVVFDAEDGATAFQLAPNGESISLRNGKKAVLASVRESGGRLAIEDASGEVAWFIERRPGASLRLRVIEAKNGATAFVIKSDSDGDVKVENGEKKRMAVAKRRDYGFKLVDPGGKLIARIRSRSGKTSVRDAAGTTYLTTRDAIPAEAVALLVFERFPIEVAAGLGVATAFWPAPMEGAAETRSAE